MSKFGTPAFSAQMKEETIHHVIDSKVLDPKIAFDKAMASPLSNRSLDIANTIGLLFHALETHAVALDTAPQNVVGQGRITGITQKLEELNTHIALGIDVSDMPDTPSNREDRIKHAAGTLATMIETVNNRGLHSNVLSDFPALPPSI